MKQILRARVVNLAKVFCISAVVSCCALFAVHAFPSWAVGGGGSETRVDIAVDLDRDRDEDGWLYDFDNGIITLLDDITLTGTLDDAAEVLFIMSEGDFTLTLEDFNLTTSAFTGLFIANDLTIDISGSNSINLYGEVSDRAGIYGYGQDSVDLTFQGAGYLEVNLNSTGAVGAGGIWTSGNIYINGGTIYIDTRTPYAEESNVAIYAYKGLTISGGTVTALVGSAKDGASAAISVGTEVNITGGDVFVQSPAGSTAPPILEDGAATISTLPAYYTWTASEDPDGVDAVSGAYPGTAFVNDEDYRYVAIHSNDGKLIDVGVHLAADHAGVDWYYDFATKTITLIDDGVVLTGTKTDATQNLVIKGDYELTVRSLTYASSTGLTVEFGSDITLNLEGYSDLQNDHSGAAFERAVIFSYHDLVIGGDGSLNLHFGSDAVSITDVVGIALHGNLEINGGSVSVETPKTAATISIPVVSGFGVGSKNFTMNGGELKAVTGGLSATGEAPLIWVSGSAIISGGTVEMIRYGDATNTAFSIKAPAVALPTRYHWTADVNSDFSDADSSNYPGIAFVDSVDYAAVRIEPYHNTRPRVEITSPADGTQLDYIGDLEFGMEISDPDVGDQWAVSVSLVKVGAVDEDDPYNWTPLVTTNRLINTFSLNGIFNNPYLSGDYYFYVGVEDNAEDVEFMATDRILITLDNTLPAPLEPLVDPATGIIVENLSGGGFAPELYLVVTKKDMSGYDLSEISKEPLALYEIRICSDLNDPCVPLAVWPRMLRIKIPLAGLLGSHEDFGLYYLADSGDIELVNSRVDGGYLVYDTNHLSDWLVAGVARGGVGGPNTGVATSDGGFARGIAVVSVAVSAMVAFVIIRLKRRA